MRVIQGVHQIDGELRPPRPSEAHVWSNDRWELDPLRHTQLMQARFQHLSDTIDGAADTARRSVVGDPLRAVEYERAASEAQAFKDAGYPDDVVPRSVAAWAIGSRSAKEAADDILDEAQAYIEVLYRLREIRLRAKEFLRDLLADEDLQGAQQLADSAIEDIREIVGGVGNAK